MKEQYESPQMLTERVDIGVLVANGASPSPIAQLQAFYGLCSLCVYDTEP